MKNKILFLATVAASLVLAQSSHASIINIDNLDPTAGDALGVFTTTVSTVGNISTVSFTGTNDFDGGGTNDTLTFDMVYEYFTGGSFDSTTGDVTLGTAAAGATSGQNWGAGSFPGGGTLSLLVQNINYTSGEGDGTTAVFDGFTGIRKIAVGGTGAVPFAVGGLTGATIVTAPNVNGDLDISSLGNNSQLYITSDAGNGSIRLRDLDLQFDTVAATIPEPSTLAIFGLGVAGLFIRRRRG